MSNIRKQPNRNCCRESCRRRWCVKHTCHRRRSPFNTRNTIEQWKPPYMTKGTEHGPHVWPRCENTLAREDHAPSTGDHFSRKTWRLDQRVAVSKARGRVSNCRRWKCIDLASKNGEKTEAHQIHAAGDTSGGCFLFGASLKCFPVNKQRRTKKIKLHKPP
jgi:hypothetical protein